jgi:hypothetical protein
MKRTDLTKAGTAELVDQLATLAAEQDISLLENNVAKANRLFDRMQNIEMELKCRPGDQRRALLALYDHPNMHVQLIAAKKTLAVAPQAARQKLEGISKSGWLPDAGDAGMCLSFLEQGIFKPT